MLAAAARERRSPRRQRVGGRAGGYHARAPPARRFRRLLDQRGAADGADARRPLRARSRERLGAELQQRLGGELERFEVAGPGFLNLFLGGRLASSRARGGTRGGASASAPARAGRRGRAERILVEFVSANPTGPMHVGHARNAAYGDALARLLAFDGYAVTREFYVNDAGSQIRKLGESIAALARGRDVPEDGYHGDYVGPLAAKIERARDARPGRAGPRGGRRSWWRGSRRSLAALPRRSSTSGSTRASCTRALRARLQRALTLLAEQRPDLPSARRRCGCAAPNSATTRTACWCARAASTRTSPPTSPTTRTSASAATSARSTCGAQTITAMCSA